MKENEASATAYAVLQGLLFLGRQNRYPGLVSDEVMDVGCKILQHSAEGQRRLKQISSSLFATLVPVIERLTVPGLSLHYGLRKRFIEDATRAVLADGYTQVVNLGAGFDTLAWRLHLEFPDINFIEIDHPATSAAKVPALASISKPGENLHFLEVDFTKQTLSERLGNFKGFHKDRKTAFICEGVISYLTAEQARELLRTLRELSPQGCRFIGTCVVPMGTVDDNTGPLLNLYLSIKGEGLKWRIAPEEVGSFFTNEDYEILGVIPTKEMKEKFLSSPLQGILHRAEYGVIAQGHAFKE